MIEKMKGITLPINCSPKEQDEIYMRCALGLAQKAVELDEVPVGAVIVSRGKIVGQGYNLREQGRDATLHAEMIAIREACQTLGGWRLLDSTLYVTLEPCPMCAGAMINARIDRLVFGACDPKAGAAGSVIDITACKELNHQMQVTSGILADEAAHMLKSFFAAKR